MAAMHPKGLAVVAGVPYRASWLRQHYRRLEAPHRTLRLAQIEGSRT